jgi:hypothetical protein
MTYDDLPFDYVREKLYVTVDALIGEGSLRERLLGAGLSLVRLHGQNPSFIADDERIRWTSIMDTLAARDEGGLDSAIRGMSDEQAHRVAREILELHELHLLNLLRRQQGESGSN